MAMEVQISSSVSLSSELNSPVGFDKQRLEEFIAEGSLEFDEWTSLISEIERSCTDDIEMISLVYDSFLVEFPLCYGYWRKYADHKARFCTIDKVVEVFERAVQSATYSVDMWFHYCSFGMLAFEDPCDVCRLFKRGLSIVGKDYLCHMLWDKYIEFEISQQHWSSLALIYVQTLRFPSKKLRLYYDSFKKLAASWKEELECQIDSAIEFQSELVLEGEVSTYYKDDKISCVIKDLLDPSVSCLVRSKALQKYLFFGEQIFKEARQFDEKVNCFETHIRRPYFHVKPLDDRQLKNWHDYLNFAEKQGDFDWVVKLHERCLIPCANYPEFWMRYVDFMESKGGREIANFALARATQIFLKRLPVIHLFNARYKEQIGDTTAARAAFLESDIDSDSRFIENITNKANMEKRLGNIVAACNIYKEALETAKENRKLHTLPLLYVHFSRLTYMNTDSADTARDILIDGIKHVPHSKLLLEELIKFTMMHGGPRHMNIVDAIISNSLYSGSDVLRVFSLKDVEDISSLYLQFVDLCGTIHDVRNAWNRHFKLFPHTVRIAYGCPARETKSLRTFIVGRRERIVASPPQPSESEHLMHSPSQDKKLSPPEKLDAESDHAATSLLSNRKSPLQENHDTQSNGAEDDIFQSGEADGSFQERMQQVHPEATEQHSQDACKPGVLSVDLVHPDANENEAVQASDEFSKEDVQQEYGHESKQDLKSLSLEGLYLDPVGNDSPGSLCFTSHECEAPQEANLSHEIMLNDAVSCETSMSDGSVLGGGQNNNLSHFPSSSMGTQAFSSAPVKTGIVSSSSSAGHQNFIPEAHSPPQKPANSDRNWHPKHNPDRVLRDPRFGFQGHSNKRQYQQRQFSSQHYPRPETDAQMPMNPGYPPQPLPSPNPQPQLGSQAQSQLLASPNLTATQGWAMQNMQQQNFAPASQSEIPTQPVFYPQAHMSQYPTQSSEQHPQNNLAYNQMWQYYYYQQQQQQFFLQQQQLQLQQQHLQPLQQQQFLQQEYQQQHQVLLPLQQQQLLPPMQQQPHQQQQQHLLYMQQQTQQQVQQQDQQPLQQQQQEQRQFEQQISVSEIETWNNNCSKQDQGVQPLGVVAFANTSAALPSPLPSPHLHQQSPQGR